MIDSEHKAGRVALKSNQMRKATEEEALDRIDCGIIDALQNDGRLTNKELAAKIGLAPSSCLARVRALTKKKIIRGYHAEIAATAMGIGMEALIAVRLIKHSRDAFKTLHAHLLTRPEVLAVMHVSGPNDLQVHVAVKDAQHLRELIMDAFATRKEVDRCETSVIFSSHRKPRLPRYVGP